MFRGWIRYIVLTLWLSPGTLLADTIPPVQVRVTELAPGAFEVRWTVPRLIPPAARPQPVLPDSCRPDSDRRSDDQPAAWVTRQTYQCPGGLAGRRIGVAYPFFNASLSTLVKADFLSGVRYARLLNPGEDSWQIPEPYGGELSGWLERGSRAVTGGLRHFLDTWIHPVFLLALLVAGGVATGVRLTGTFLIAQLCAVAATSVAGLQLAPPPAEAGVAVAGLLLLREALRPASQRRRLTALTACAGAAHGLGLSSLLAAADVEGAFDLGLAALGMDSALLIGVAIIGYLGRAAAARIRFDKGAVAACLYGVAGFALALAIQSVVQGPAAQARPAGGQLDLASPAPASTAASLPASARVASSVADSALQSFVSVEAFEVRVETLVRVRDFAWVRGLAREGFLLPDRQPAIRERIGELVLEQSVIGIDGVEPDPVSQRINFMTLDAANGALPRAASVPEPVDEAWIGVTEVFITRSTPREVTLSWQLPETVDEIPATVSDPESSRSVLLTELEPALVWRNELVDDPVPVVSAVAVEPPRIPIPLWSILPLAAAIALGGVSWRRGPAVAAATVRPLLAVAIIVAPLAHTTVGLPAAFAPAPGGAEAARILSRVLPNIYRAFEFRVEPVVFDRLALSITGETLTDIYLEQRRALALEERGGAQASVEAVQVTDVRSVESIDGGGFTADASWTVGGTVTHFGHRHFRQNRYDATVDVVPVDGVWKIRSIEVVNEERLR